MKATIIVIVLILVGLTTTGAVQAYRYFRKQYLELTSLWEELTSFLKSRKAERQKRAQPVQPVIIRFEKPATVEQPSQEVITPDTSDEKEVQMDEMFDANTLFITVETEDREYSLTESISVDEWQQLSRTITDENVPIEQEMMSVHTLLKLKDSPMMTHLIGSYGQRIKKLLSNAVLHEQKQPKRTLTTPDI